MPIDESFIQFIKDQLHRFGEVKSRNMFGGVGLYYSNIMFALVYEEELYFRSDKDSANNFTDCDTHQFKPFKDKPMKMPYWNVPEDILDDIDLLEEWALDAWEKAKEAKREKNKK